LDSGRINRAEDLLALCRAARKAGVDFPDVWHQHLKRHPLVADIPTHIISAGRPILSVPLVGGRHLLFDDEEVHLR